MSQLIMNAACFAAQVHKHQMRSKMNVPYIKGEIKCISLSTR